MNIGSGVNYVENETYTGLDSKYVDISHETTGNPIQGWVWDKSIWKDTRTENSKFKIPLRFDVLPSGLTNADYLSGVGDLTNHETELNRIYQPVTDSGIYQAWLPEIHNGYYYFGARQHWLYSDDSEKVIISTSGTDTVNDSNQVDLLSTPKAGAPILATRWSLNRTTGEYEHDLRLIKVIDFTGVVVSGERVETRLNSGEIIWDNVDRTKLEFVVDTIDSGINTDLIHTVKTNNDYRLNVGTATVTGVSDLADLELLGQHTGEDNFVIDLKYIPLLADGTVEIWTSDSTSVQQWPILTEFTASSSGVIVNLYDGSVRFGRVGYGEKPSPLDSIYAKYVAGLEIEYEPNEIPETTIYRTGFDGQIRPIFKSDPTGFVLLQRAAANAHSLTLSATATSLALTDHYGPVYVGNTYVPLTATVYDEYGNLVEGVEVSFDILSVSAVGGFGDPTPTETSAVSDSDGEAQALYLSPRNVSELGLFTQDTTQVGSTTEVVVESTTVSEDPEQIIIYEVLSDDLVLGTQQSATDYYNQYFAEHGMDGLTANQTWESNFRTINGLLVPRAYSSGKTDGNRRVLVDYSDEAWNPYTGTAGAWIPLLPSGISIGSTSTTLTYSSVLPEVPASGVRDGYFVISPQEVDIRARAWNDRTGTYVYSNTITLHVDLQQQKKGLFIASALNEIPADLSRFAANTSGLVPFGFMLRSSNISIASALDAATFISIQSTTSGSAQHGPTTGVVTLVSGDTSTDTISIWNHGSDDYEIDLKFSWVSSSGANDETGYTITDKTEAGFVINVSSAPPPGGGTITWAIVPVEG